jgi:DNA-binding beta-propeller fold protein YncE
LVGISDSDNVEVLTFAGNLAGASATNGIGTTSQFNSPYGVSVSPDGVYALVSETGSNLIRKIIIATAEVSNFAGGTQGSTNAAGTSSQFSSPWGVTISPNGVYALVPDVGNSLIRKIIITTASVSNFAGILGSSGSTNGAGTSSKLTAPRCVAISADGVFALVAESGSQLIRKIVIATATVSLFAGI